MSRVFERTEQLKDRVFDVKLRMDEWKVLFAINGVMDSRALAEFLDMKLAEVNGALDKLQDLQFIRILQTVEAAPMEAAAPETLDLEEEPGVEIPDLEEPISLDLEEEDIQAVEEETGLDELTRESFGAEEAAEKEGAADEDLDELIGNLLEEETTSLPSADETLELPEEPGTRAEPEDEFDLETIFKEDVAETEESLDEMLGTLEMEEPETVAAPPAREVIEETGQGTILVVDDSVVIRKMVEIALENENYNIVSVATGKEALNFLDESTPDLIILDIMLTDMNGLDVLKAIKASKQIPVVMLSAKDTPRETTKAKQLGADDFIPKPFKDEELVGKIKELIKR